MYERGSTGAGSVLARLQPGLDELAGADLPGLSDAELREQVLGLVMVANRVWAALAARLVVFDARGLAVADAARTTKAWLCGFARLSPYAAKALLERAEALAALPELARAAAAGAVSAEQVGKVVDLAGKVGLSRVKPFDRPLAELAAGRGPGEVAAACERIRAHLDPDGPEPDPKAYQRRGLSFAPCGSLVLVKGQLTRDAAATILAAINAQMRPPTTEESDSPAARRADALVDLCEQHLRRGNLPEVGGVKPQVGLLIPAPPGLLAHLAQQVTNNRNDSRIGGDGGGRANDIDHCEASRDGDARGSGGRGCGGRGGGDGHRHGHGDASPENGDDSGHEHERSGRYEPSGHGTDRPDLLSRAGIKLAPEQPWLDWFGHVPPQTAQRLCCDAEIWRVLLDPATGQPLDVGRSYRVAPYWIRRALHTRDRGCRFPGCQAVTAWCDAHHIIHWLDGGTTDLANLIELCRFHHMLVHEGDWEIRLDPETGEVTAYRPTGEPYELNPSRPAVGPLRAA